MITLKQLVAATAIAGLAVTALAGGPTLALGGSNGPASEPTIARDLRRATGGAADDFTNALLTLQRSLDIAPGNGTITVEEIGIENYRALTKEIAAIGDRFDAVTSFPSDLYKLGVWAITMYAQQYDDNPRMIPIATPITLLFVAAALIFAPLVFLATGGTLYDGGGTVPGVDGLVPFLSPALRSFSGSSARKDAGPLVSAADEQQIRSQLESRGMAGDALDGVTRILKLGAALAVADARR